MGIAEAIIAAGVVTAGAGIYSSKKAADAQKNAANLASSTELKMYYQSRDDLAPWREAGTWALTKLQELVKEGPGEFTKDPGYEFRLSEGIKALERGASARGKVLSGEEGKTLTKFGQDYATGEYENFLNRFYKSLTPFQSLANVGQTSSAQTATLGVQTGNQVGQNYLHTGQAEAGGYINQSNALTGSVNDMTKSYLMWDMLGSK